MEDMHSRIQLGGAWLATASVLMIVVLVLHGPIATEHATQMARISSRPTLWVLAHWIAAVALSVYAGAALIMLGTRSRLTARPGPLSSWAVIVIGSLWTLNTAVVEATAITDAAIAGHSDMYEGWWAYAEGKANGFAFVALALAVIAASDARAAHGATPAWAAWAAAAAGVASFAGWALGMWFDVGIGSALWVAASILLSAWSAWFGITLVRSHVDSPAPAPPAAVARSAPRSPV